MQLAKLSFVFIILSMVSCKMEPKTPVAKPQKFDQKTYQESLEIERSKHLVKKKDTTVLVKKDSTKIPTTTTKLPPETTDTIEVKIVQGKVKMDTLKSPRQRLVFVLNTDTANKLDLKITPNDSIANLRISQIIDSKENSDGPFGQTILYPIVEKGIHYIIVSESQMQGEPWGGRFLFEAKLKW